MQISKIKITFHFSLFTFLFSLLPFLSYLLLSCVASPPAGPVAIPADIAGLVHGGFSNSPEEYELLDRLGARWILRTFDWVRIEPEEGQWDFSHYDAYVDAANANGIKVFGVLGYDVPWIHEGGSGPRYIPPDKMPFFLEYARRTAEHFQGRVDAWCIWNEPNHRRFWRGSREGFFELTRLSAQAVREADPDVLILGGAFNRGVFGLPRAFVRGLFETGAMEQADGVAFHPYELNPKRTAALYRSFRSITARYGFEDRIWVNEVGYPTGGRYPTATTDKKFPEFVAKTFIKLAAEGSRTIFWYQLFDPENRNPKNSENFFGLVRSRSDVSSKGAEAFRLCALHIAGTVYRPDLPLRIKLPASLQAYYFEKPDGGGTLALWKDGRPMRLALDLPGDARAMHDPVTGIASAIPAETAIDIGRMPVFITWEAVAASSGAASSGAPVLQRGGKR